MDSAQRLHTESAFFMQGGELVSAGQPVLTVVDNKDSTHAVALHLTDAMTWGRLTLTPGARVELISSTSANYLTRAKRDGLVAAAMPGIGAYVALRDELGALAGVYRGFSPPAPGRDAAIGATARHYDVVGRDPQRVRRVVFDPAELVAAPCAHPCVHGIRSLQPRLAGRGDRAQETGHVAGGNANSAEAGDHHLREVLADPAPPLESMLRGRVDVGCLPVIGEVVVDARAERLDRLAGTHAWL